MTYREDTGSLKVVRLFNTFRTQSAKGKPFLYRYSLIECRVIIQTSFESVVEAIRTSYIVVFSHWHYIDTNTFGYIDMPLIDGYSCDNVAAVERPAFTYTTVFYPDFRIVCCQCIIDYCILYKDSRMRFYLFMHDGTLVDDTILYSQCR